MSNEQFVRSIVTPFNREQLDQYSLSAKGGFFRHETQLLSLTVGVVGGVPSSLATFVHRVTGGPLAPITLEEIASNLDKNQQEVELNKPGRHVVCYGSLYVRGQQQNVVAFR